MLLMVFGVALVATASPAVSQTIGVDDFHFLKKHIVFLIPAIGVVFGLSMLTPRYTWRAASLLLILT